MSFASPDELNRGTVDACSAFVGKCGRIGIRERVSDTAITTINRRTFAAAGLLFWEVDVLETDANRMADLVAKTANRSPSRLEDCEFFGVFVVRSSLTRRS